MEPSQSPQEQFSAARTHFYKTLKTAYLNSVEKAADKVYAEEFYQRIYFSNNTKLPYWSVAYHNLIVALNHSRKLDPTTDIEQTLQLWPEIVKNTNKFYITAGQANLFDNDSLPLHGLYLNALDSGLSLGEIIEQEQQVLESDEKRLIELLALNDATRQLLDEFSKELQEEMKMDLVGNALTRSQQVLIAYYIGRLLDVYHDKKVTKCAKALHAFLQIPYSGLVNSDLYKKLLHPLPDKPSTIHHLKIVRSFFEDLELDAAIDMIDEDIQIITEKKKN